VTETGLIVAEVVFLVLLYAFVWTVVRSAGRQLRPNAPPPHAAEPPPTASPASPPAPEVAAAVVAASSAPPLESSPLRDVPPPTVVPPTQETDDERLNLALNLDPRLVVESSPDLEEGRVIPLEVGITIGRSDGADLSIVDAFVSHMHARILRRGSYHYVEDLGSTNGTFLNDLRVEHDAQLKVHDSLRIGQTTLRYEE
jgi:FHA domain